MSSNVVVSAKNIPCILGMTCLKYKGMYLDRAISKRLFKLLELFPAVVVSGARQVGKRTLLVHHLVEKADFVVFDPVLDVEDARRDPELFFENHSTPLVLDEIQ